jgi:hypothetical protein
MPVCYKTSGQAMFNRHKRYKIKSPVNAVGDWILTGEVERSVSNGISITNIYTVETSGIKMF